MKLFHYWKQFVSFESVPELWENQPTYLLVQILFMVGGIVTLIHAFIYKGRRPVLWFSIICHGLVVECMCYAMADIDNFWHSRTPVMFFGQRLPLYVIILYSVFYYIAIEIAYRANRLKIGLMVSVGLNVLLIDIPYDIIGIKFIYWTWHDTDPNLGDRSYWVPLTSYYFHMVFSASFVFWFFTKDVDLEHTFTWKKEIFMSLRAILFSTPCGVFCFSVLYHPLHDIYYVPTQIVLSLLIAFYVMLATLNEEPRSTFNCSLSIVVYLGVYYTTFLFLAVWGNPQNEISTGWHEEIGPCNITVSSFGTLLNRNSCTRLIFSIMKQFWCLLNNQIYFTPESLDLKKRKYLCIEDYNEDFDFHCVKNIPAQYSQLYTICGTPFENRMEYVVLVITITIVAFNTYFNKSFKIANKLKKLK